MYSHLACPKCKSSRVSVYDTLPLDKSILDTEIYAYALCLDCKHKFPLIGDINWRQLENPKPNLETLST